MRFRPGADCPATLLDRAHKLFDAAPGEALSASKADKLPALLAEAERAGHEMRCYDDALAFIAEQRDAKERQRVLAEAYPQRGLRRNPIPGPR